MTLTGLHRALIGAAETGAGGRLFVEVEERPDETPPPVKTRELETEYRAIVEEILELRDADPRDRRVPALDRRARRARRHRVPTRPT